MGCTASPTERPPVSSPLLSSRPWKRTTDVPSSCSLQARQTTYPTLYWSISFDNAHYGILVYLVECRDSQVSTVQKLCESVIIITSAFPSIVARTQFQVPGVLKL